MSIAASEGGEPHGPFVRRTLVVLALALAVLTAALLVWEALFLVLLIFAGVLLAVFLDGLARWLEGRIPLGHGPALVLVVTALLGLTVAAVWFLGPPLVTQMTALVRQVPSAAGDVEAWLRNQGWGSYVLQQIPEADALQSRASTILGRVTGVFSTTLGVLANVLIVLFLGVYLAVDPGLYRGGVLRLLPSGRRARGAEVLDALCGALRSWLLGRLASMAVVAGLTGLGLVVLGVPLALSLALLAGVLSFVPYLGPMASALPALAVAWLESPTLTLWVAGLYLAVQLVESYVITPVIQQRVVSMAPALLITAQILLGMAAGVTGVLLATPLAVVVVVLVQTLYVQDVLGDDVEVLGA